MRNVQKIADAVANRASQQITKDGARNDQGYSDGTVATIAGDGKTASVTFLGDTAATAGVGIPKHLAGGITVGDRVRVMSANPRDMWIMFAKQ